MRNERNKDKLSHYYPLSAPYIQLGSCLFIHSVIRDFPWGLQLLSKLGKKLDWCIMYNVLLECFMTLFNYSSSIGLLLSCLCMVWLSIPSFQKSGYPLSQQEKLGREWSYTGHGRFRIIWDIGTFKCDLILEV